MNRIEEFAGVESAPTVVQGSFHPSWVTHVLIELVEPRLCGLGSGRRRRQWERHIGRCSASVLADPDLLGARWLREAGVGRGGNA